VYRTFSETHLIEIVGTDGHPVAVGARGDVVVTQFAARAAPIIRYRVGDRATYRGWEQGRLLLSDIERSAEAAIGSTLVPYSDLRTCAPRLAALGHPVVAVQLVRACSPGDRREEPVVRVIGPASGAVAPLTAVVENPRTRRAVSALVPDGQHVQMLFRLGRSPGPLPPTPRRDPTWAASRS